MPHRPALPRRSLRTAAGLLALLAASTATAPAAWATVDESASSVDQTDTLTTPVPFGAGELRLLVGEEQGNELGYDVDLGGATIRVSFTGPDDDGEIYDCTTDATGRCRFGDDGDEFTLSVVPGDEVTVEQLSAPSSGVFDLPAGQDAVVHAVVPVTAQGIPADRTTPVQATASPEASSPDVVHRMAPDVLSKPGTWTQVVFFDPLAATGETDPGTGDPVGDAPTAGGTAPDTSSSTAGASAPTTGADTAPAVTTSGATAEPAASTSPTSAPSASRGPTASPVAGAPLATTGTDLAPMLVLGSALLVAGAGGLLAARRRRAH